MNNKECINKQINEYMKNYIYIYVSNDDAGRGCQFFNIFFWRCDASRFPFVGEVGTANQSLLNGHRSQGKAED